MDLIEINPPVIAHRGASAYAPENTFAAFLKAKELGARWLEFDVMLAACGEVVVIHDETLNRTTNQSGFVDQYTYRDLQTLDAGSWFDPLFSAEIIPTLEKTIDFLYRHQLAANIEIKASLGQEDITAKKVVELIRQYWRKEMTPPLISSFSLNVLQAVRRHSSASALGFLMDEWRVEWKTLADSLNCISIHCNETILTPERIKKMKSTGRLLLSYTVNTPERARELFSSGVDAVFTDCPDKILNSLTIGGKNDEL